MGIIINFILRVTLDSMSTEKLVALDPNNDYKRITIFLKKRILSTSLLLLLIIITISTIITLDHK